MEQENSCLRSRAEMCSLADLASRFVLSLCVCVRSDLGNEDKKQYCQAESEQPSQVPPYLCPVNHSLLK
jgi:hypothetical protein